MNHRTNVTRTDSSTVAFRYDNAGELIVADCSVNAEDRGYCYDAGWNLARLTNNGVTSTFTVNTLNELTNAPSGSASFDSNGNTLTSHGGDWTYQYDDENRLISLQIAINGTNSTFSDFYYDGFGRPRKRLEYIWVPPAQGTNPPDGDGPIFGGLDSPQTETNWSLISETRYIYDGNRVIQERDGNNTPTVTYTRGTDLSGSLEGAGGIGGLLARSSGYSSVNGSWSTHYYYHADGNGNITYLVDSSQSIAASYTYDPFGNLLRANGAQANANVYRFSSKEVHLSSGLCYYLLRFYDPALQRWANHYHAGWSSPSDGDVQTVFVYDGLGRLRERFEYVMARNAGEGPAGAQNGALPDSGGGTCDWSLQSVTESIYDGNRVIQERDINNNPVVTYTRGTDLSGSLEGAGGIGGLLARTSGYSGVNGSWSTHYYYHADGNGNITYLVDGTQALAASYRYDPFGNLISSSGTLASQNVYRFSSKEIHVNSGMYYYLYRFYDPSLQRWISRDPIGELGGINLYAFASNDGVDYADLFGLAERRVWPDRSEAGFKVPGSQGEGGNCLSYAANCGGRTGEDRRGLGNFPASQKVTYKQMVDAVVAALKESKCREKAASGCDSDSYWVIAYFWGGDADPSYHAVRSDNGGKTWSQRAGPNEPVYYGATKPDALIPPGVKPEKREFCCPKCKKN